MDAKIISLRVSAKMAAAITRLARELRTTQSGVIKEGLDALLKRRHTEKSAYELGEDLFGRHGSGRRDTSTRRRALYREHARAKHARR